MLLTAPPIPRLARAALLALAVPCTALTAQTIPDGRLGAGSCLIFGCTDVSRLQTVYSGARFGAAPVRIRSLTFFNSVLDRPDENDRLTRGRYDIFLSTLAGPLRLDADLDRNVGTGRTLFTTLFIDGIVRTAPSFTLIGAAFDFNPLAGNLLLEIRANYFESRPNGGGNNAFLDANLLGADATSAFCIGTQCPAGQLNDRAFVTQFNAPATVVPEPSTVLLLASGLGAVALVRRRRVR